MNHLGTQTIETERLILRQINLNDAKNLSALLNDGQVQEFLAGIPANYTEEMAVDYIGNYLSKSYSLSNFYDWGIIDKQENKLVGRICVYKFDDERRMANLVWYIIPAVRGKGIITEAGKAVVNFLKNVGFERIEAFANVENLASIRVMEKLGMQYEGTLRKYDCRRDNSLYDVKMYAIINELR